LNIALFGFMGTGKTAVGHVLAGRLGWAFLDTDEMIEKQVGMSVSKIFAAAGEPAFRDMEAQTIRLAALMDKAVISTGGGAVLREENVRELEKKGLTVCLNARPETIMGRLKDDVDTRPLLQGADPFLKVQKILNDRRAAYARVRHAIGTDDLSPDQVADQIMALLPSGVR
jgi:shikimate kinase